MKHRYALGIDIGGSGIKGAIVDLKKGDDLLLFTDGLIEARNFGEEQYGKQRIIESLKKPAANADAVAKNVLWDLRRFTGFKRNDCSTCRSSNARTHRGSRTNGDGCTCSSCGTCGSPRQAGSDHHHAKGRGKARDQTRASARAATHCRAQGTQGTR